MTTNLPDTIYSEKELTRATDAAQMKGWVQGAGVVVGGAIAWNLLGWIPVLLVLGAVGFVLYKILSRPSGEERSSTPVA